MNISETQQAIVGIEAVLIILTTAVAAQNRDPKEFVAVVRHGVEDALKAKGLELGCELKTAEETADFILRSALKSVEQMKPIPE